MVAKLDAVKVARVTGDIPQEVNFAVKGSDAIAFLKSAGVAITVGPPVARLDTAEVAAMARGFTVQILCW